MTPKWIKRSNESASRIGQYMHDEMRREFDVFDGDHAHIDGFDGHIKAGTHKKRRNCVRIIEEKLPHETISKGQNRWMGRVASMIQDAKHGDTRLSEDSAVLLLHWRDDDGRKPAERHTPVEVSQVMPDGTTRHLGSGPVSTFHSLLNGDPAPELMPPPPDDWLPFPEVPA